MRHHDPEGSAFSRLVGAADALAHYIESRSELDAVYAMLADLGIGIHRAEGLVARMIRDSRGD
jgi:hypothetical protein